MTERPRPPLVFHTALGNTLIDVSDIRLGHDRPDLPWALVTVYPVEFQLHRGSKGGLIRKGFNCFEIYDLWDLLLVSVDAPGILFRGDQLAVVVRSWPSGANVHHQGGGLLRAFHASVTLEEWQAGSDVNQILMIRVIHSDVRDQVFTTTPSGRVYFAPWLGSDPRGPIRSTRVPNQTFLAGFIPQVADLYPAGPVRMRELVKRLHPGIVRQYEEERRAWFEGETPEEEPYLSRKR